MQAMTSRSITRRIHAASVSPALWAKRCTFACNRSDTAAPIFRSGMICPNWSRRCGRPIMRIWPVCCDGDRESDCDGIGTRPRTQVTQLYRNKKARETQRANTHNLALRPAGRDRCSRSCMGRSSRQLRHLCAKFPLSNFFNLALAQIGRLHAPIVNTMRLYTNGAGQLGRAVVEVLQSFFCVHSVIIYREPDLMQAFFVAKLFLRKTQIVLAIPSGCR